MGYILHKFVKAAAVLLGAGLAAAPAAAQVTAVLTASQPHYFLTDLAPNDGQAAAIRFQPGMFFMDGQVLSDRNGSQLHTERVTAYEGDLLTLDTSWEGRAGMAASILPGEDFLAGLRTSAFANPGDGIQHYTDANATHINEFELAPHTMLTMSADVALQLHIAPASIGAGSSGVQGYMSLSFYRGAEGYDDKFLIDGMIPGHENFSGHIDRVAGMSVAVVNPTDEWALGRFEFSLNSRVQLVAAPVPEAPTWGMYACGLLGCAFVARRRRGVPVPAPMPL